MLAPIHLLVLPLLYLFSRLVLYTLHRRRSRSLGCSPVPVYPHKDPILGLDLFRDTLRAINTHTLLQLWDSRFRNYGNTHYTLTLGKWVLMTNEPENVKLILGTKMDEWPLDGPRLHAAVPVLGRKSVFTTNGAQWREARGMIRPSFVRDQVADLHCFSKHVGNFLNAIPKNGSTFDMQELLLSMTMDSSTDFLLGYSTNSLLEPSPEAKQFLEDFEYTSREAAKKARLGTLLLLLPDGEFQAAVTRVREYVRTYIRKSQAEKTDKKERDYIFLHEILQSGADEEHAIDQVLSVIIAGRDTTAAAMTACFYYLARNPEAVQKLRKEILDVEDEMPTWEQLKNMKYLNMVIKEGLRLFPPASTNSRAPVKDTVLPRGGGPDGKQPIFVPKGQVVRWSLYSMHRRKDIFGEDADEFRPERWDENLRVGWEYIPFSGGPRICLGQQFALTQMEYALFKFFRAFKSIEPRDADSPLLLRTNLTVTFANGCLVSATPDSK
ncbi:cytochrome P450 [Copromyces sp. CBS 386.78]|nr:cytochrome P450 [Copromyces sp. CBS 386.78]